MARFTPQGDWTSDTIARNIYTGEKVNIGGKDGRLDFGHNRLDPILDLSGSTDPDGVAIAFNYKGTNLLNPGPLFTTMVFNLGEKSSFLDLTSPFGNYQASVLVNGKSGNDVVWSGDGRDRILGNGGDDRLFGGGGADNIRGGDGADKITGYAGDDVLFGNDLEGRPDQDRDVFVYYDEGTFVNGSDAIRGFEKGYDKIDLSDFAIADQAAFMKSAVKNQPGGPSTVNLGQDGFITVHFASATPNADKVLASSDFIF